MKRSRFPLWLAAMLALGSIGMPLAGAQTGAPDETMRLVAARAVGMPEGTFEVSTTANVLIVVRVNSTMNASTHEGRNNEASAIAAAIAAEFKRKGEPYAAIQSISVDYVDRSGAPLHDDMVDRIDFRKNAAGTFVLHVT